MSSSLQYGLISILLTPIVTCVTMRLKTLFCDSYSRMPVLFRTDMHLVISTNVIAQLLILLWSEVLPVSVELLLALDVLLGLGIEHWLLRLVYSEETGHYHVAGAYARQKLRRRYGVTLSLAILIRSSCAALSSALHVPLRVRPAWQQLVAVLLLYVIVRTLLVDCVGHAREPAAAVDVDVDEGEIQTNSFVITDEEEDELSSDVL